MSAARVFLAEEAARLGLVNEVVEPEQVVERALDYAAELAANSSPGIDGVMKQQVYAD